MSTRGQRQRQRTGFKCLLFSSWKAFDKFAILSFNFLIFNTGSISYLTLGATGEIKGDKIYHRTSQVEKRVTVC